MSYTELTFTQKMEMFRAIAEYFHLNPHQQADFFRIPEDEANSLSDYFAGTNQLPESDWFNRLVKLVEFRAVAHSLIANQPAVNEFVRKSLELRSINGRPIDICLDGTEQEIAGLTEYMKNDY